MPPSLLEIHSSLSIAAGCCLVIWPFDAAKVLSGPNAIDAGLKAIGRMYVFNYSNNNNTNRRFFFFFFSFFICYC